MRTSGLGQDSITASGLTKNPIIGSGDIIIDTILQIATTTIDIILSNITTGVMVVKCTTEGTTAVEVGGTEADGSKLDFTLVFFFEVDSEDPPDNDESHADK